MAIELQKGDKFTFRGEKVEVLKKTQVKVQGQHGIKIVFTNGQNCIFLAFDLIEGVE